MKKVSINQIATCGVMAALVALGTSIIKIPVPSTGGYVHIGDSLVYIAGVLLGPIFGGISAAIGSMIADLIGYPLYAVPTFVIKGLDAWLVGMIYMQTGAKAAGLNKKIAYYVLSFIAGGAVMVTGYFLFETNLYGFEAAFAAVPPNILQAVAGGVLGIPLLLAIEKTGMIKMIGKRS